MPSVVSLLLWSSTLVALPALAEAQSAVAPPVDTAKVYLLAEVEQKPQPAGGMDGLMQYLAKNLKIPCVNGPASSSGKAYRVFVGFTVLADGRISKVQVEKGAGTGLDEEALRVIRKMPPWTPGRQNGQPVKVAYTVPVTFTY